MSAGKKGPENCRLSFQGKNQLKWAIILFCRCSKILGETGKQEILPQMFRKFQPSNRLPNRYSPKIDVGCPCQKLIETSAFKMFRFVLFCFEVERATNSNFRDKYLQCLLIKKSERIGNRTIPQKELFNFDNETTLNGYQLLLLLGI